MLEPKASRDELLVVLVEELVDFAIVLCDTDGRLATWNPGVLNIFGYERAEFLGQPAAILFTPEDREAGVPEREFEAAREQGRASDTRVLVKKGGERIVVEGVTIALRRNDRLLGFGKVMRDVTDRTKAERTASEKVQSMARELERSNNELQEFARIASHDLSAPITSTRWLADLLASRHGNSLNPDGQKIVAQIITGLQRMSDLVEGVLAHAQVGITAIGSTEAVDTLRAFEASLHNLERDIANADAVITRGRLPAVYIDPFALTQLFQNLLSNAIKYRRPGTRPEVHIEASGQPGYELFSVRDNGVGIVPEWFDRIFLPMQRGPVGEISGSGIGLATCKKIVSRVGGSIWVDSTVGEGSTFFFTLPVPAEGGS